MPSDTHNTSTQHTKHIPLEGTPNFRDLGGYPTTDGKTVKYGRLYRSGHLAALTDNDHDTLSRLNLSVVCDFRGQVEIEHNPSHLPDPLQSHIKALSIEPGYLADMFKKIMLDPEQDLSVEKTREMMQVLYRQLAIESTPVYQQLIDETLQLAPDNALLFHCTAGKDRTGFAAALLLMCLGVERDVIMQDYLLTTHYFSADIAAAKRIGKSYNIDAGQMDTQFIRAIYETNADYLQAAFDAIDEAYGSTEQYLQQAYQLNADKLTQLKALYLES